MNRRDLLKGSTLFGAAVATGCATPRAAGGAVDGPDMEEYLARMDADLDAMDRADLRPALRTHLGPIADDPRLGLAMQAQTPLAIKAAKSLYLAAVFRDLPEHARAHPTIQKRMLDAGPMMTEAIVGMRDHLAGLSDARKKELQSKLRSDPLLGDALCRALDDQVGQTRVQTERRTRQRMVLSSYAWRMQHQSVAAVIDPQLDKANRFLAALERASDERDDLRSDDSYRPPVTGTTVGLAMMGIGAAVGVLGLLLLVTPAGSVGFLGTTVGGAVLVIGVLVFAVSAIIEANIERPRGPGEPVPPQQQPQMAAPPI